MRIYPAAIQRDIIRRFAGPFLFCFFVIVSLLVMQFLILFTDRLVGKDLPIMIILELIFSNLASLVVLAVPMSVLAASLLVYGKLSELNEYTALRAAGVHPWNLLSPIFVIAGLLFFGMIYFSNIILPQANLEAKRLWSEIRFTKPSFDLQPGVFYEGIDGYTFLARNVDSETDSLYQITLYRDQGSSGRAVFRAEKAHLTSEASRQTLRLELFDGHVTRWIPQSTPNKLLEQSNFGSYTIRFDLSSMNPSQTNPDDLRNDRSMSIPELGAVIDSISTEIDAQFSFFIQKENLALKKIQTSLFDSLSSLYRHEHIPQQSTLPEYMTARMDTSSFVFLSSGHLPPLDRITALRMSVESLRSSQLDMENLTLNLKWRYERIAQYQVEIYKKVAVPFVCILFFLCGACIGLLSRRGNLGFAAIVSAILSTVYWISIIQGEKLADRMFISPLVGTWTGNAILLTLAVILMYRVFVDRYPFQKKSMSTS